jgi:HKD family nuclease
LSIDVKIITNYTQKQKPVNLWKLTSLEKMFELIFAAGQKECPQKAFGGS